jgi:hypothetical protein
MLNVIQVVSGIILCVFYSCVAYVATAPKVTEEFRAYYIKKNTLEWRPQRYQATISDGFDFSRDGYPDFVRLTSGISGREDWGRWTDANLDPKAKIVFSNPIRGVICLELRVKPAKAQLGNRVAIDW